MNRKRLRLTFSLRALLLWILPVAVATTWMTMRFQSAQRQRAGVTWVQQQKGHLLYDYEMPLPDGSGRVNAQPPGPGWLRGLVGIDWMSEVHVVILDNQEIDDLSPLANLEQLRSLAIMINVMPETDMTPITRLKHLKTINFDWTHLTEDQLQTLQTGLPTCEIRLGENSAVR